MLGKSMGFSPAWIFAAGVCVVGKRRLSACLPHYLYGRISAVNGSPAIMQHFKQSHSKCGMICSLKGKVSKADETGKGKKSDVIKDSG